METIAVAAKKRDELGKKATKAVRNEGMIPCVLYGGEKNRHFAVTPYDVRDLIYTPEFRVAEVEIDGEKYKCIVKSFEMHPLTEQILHIDFLRLLDGRPVKFKVPVRLQGTPEGVKAGGILQQVMRKVTIKAVPKDLVDHLELDVTHLEMGQSIRVRDIKLPSSLEILDTPGAPIGSIVTPRSLRSAASAAAKAGEEGEEMEEGEESEGAEGEESED